MGRSKLTDWRVTCATENLNKDTMKKYDMDNHKKYPPGDIRRFTDLGEAYRKQEDERQWLKEISPYWPLVEVVDSGSGEDPQLVATTLLRKQDEQTGEWMVIHHIEREKYDKIDKLVAMRRLHQKINQSVYISMLFYDVSAMREYNRADGQPVDDKSRLQISEQERMKKKLQ